MFGAALPLGSAMAGMAAVFDPLPAAFSVIPCGFCVFAGGLLLTWEVTGLAGRLLLKGTVSRDFRPFFYLKFRPSHLGPIWIVKNGFANFFVFAKIFDCKVRKSGVRIVNTRRTRNFFFTVDMDIFIFLNYCYWMCKHTCIPLVHSFAPVPLVRSFEPIAIVLDGLSHGFQLGPGVDGFQ